MFHVYDIHIMIVQLAFVHVGTWCPPCLRAGLPAPLSGTSLAPRPAGARPVFGVMPGWLHRESESGDSADPGSDSSMPGRSARRRSAPAGGGGGAAAYRASPEA